MCWNTWLKIFLGVAGTITRTTSLISSKLACCSCACQIPSSSEGSGGGVVAGLQDVGRLEWSDIRVFEELTYLCKLRRRKGLVAYVIPSRKYLSKKTGFCITTVSRATNRLVSQGLLRKTQRRPVRGIYQTYVYKAVPRKFWRLAATLGKLWSSESVARVGWPTRRVTGVALKHLREKKITLHPPKEGELSQSSPLLERLPLLQTWLARGKGR